MDIHEVKLLHEQLYHALDLLNGRTQMLEARLSHLEDRQNLRLSALEQSQADQEARLRGAVDAVVRLNTSSSLAQAAQAAFSLLLAALAAWLGSQK